MIPNHPADLPLFSRAEVARMLGLPYRRVIQAFAKRRQQYVTLTLQNVYDIGLEGQGEWLYGADGPVAYRPIPGVLIDPRVQSGRPCLEGTGTTTAAIASRVSANEPIIWGMSADETIAEVARMLGVDEQLVRAAVEFEGLL